MRLNGGRIVMWSGIRANGEAVELDDNVFGRIVREISGIFLVMVSRFPYYLERYHTNQILIHPSPNWVTPCIHAYW